MKQLRSPRGFQQIKIRGRREIQTPPKTSICSRSGDDYNVTDGKGFRDSRVCRCFFPAPRLWVFPPSLSPPKKGVDEEGSERPSSLKDRGARGARSKGNNQTLTLPLGLRPPSCDERESYLLRIDPGVLGDSAVGALVSLMARPSAGICLPYPPFSSDLFICHYYCLWCFLEHYG